ncbi:hypothetical protein Y032_0099g3201 [Ancylostoma ceylanicum]|uniref:Bromo domain-containing protein n=1 Tax=Ancylostoma ceylanicum TaxID=53326 RepID=A0A016TI44_9BILA|nr:hypothetical protein Y032_0099g3201 [Ancylostoma ceylanicum]
MSASSALLKIIVKHSYSDPLQDDIVNLYDSLFDLPSDQIVEYCRRQMPKLALDDEILKHLAESNPTEAPVEPGWKTDCRTILRSVMEDPCASHFLEANAATNEDVALALQQTCDLTSLMEALERGDIDQPATLLRDVEKMVHACKTSIDDKRSPIYRDSLALGSLFAERMKGVISQYERIWKSLIDPAGRSLRKRSRRERTQSKYNTRSHDRNGSSNFDPQQPSTSHSGRSPGYYRDLVNGRLSSDNFNRRSSTRQHPHDSTSVTHSLRSRSGAVVDLPFSAAHMQDNTSGVSDDSAPSISSRGTPIRTRTSTRRRQLAREPSGDSTNSPARSAAPFSSPPSSVPRSDDERQDESLPDENDDDSSQDDEEEEEKPVRSTRTRAKRRIRQSSEGKC